MIYIPETHHKTVDYLIHQALQGNHILFDIEDIKKVAVNIPTITLEEAYSVEHHLEKLIELSTLENQKKYILALDNETYFKVIQVYFNIIENNLYEKVGVFH